MQSEDRQNGFSPLTSDFLLRTYRVQRAFLNNPEADIHLNLPEVDVASVILQTLLWQYRDIGGLLRMQ